ncbi:YbjP/YqhG family protein [Pseudomonas sp. P9_31]|uniref:YbjP/YqhG family protein n=1 Tax=Pseudomonas sp. P9_31 TaxID=3043448 RepID=UPI002A370A50|nr:YbjP/YqhG family protein [Pseudomonas sp. P9_31]WPN56045.1 YbjP/YqhG family protein [Pseudomonas sp. P9_31]
MRILVLLVVGLLTACSVNSDRLAIQQVSDFYAFYLKTFTDSPPPSYQSAEMQRYVALDTLNRLTAIENIPEQEIVNSDYFIYGQDYDPAWIPAFKAGPERDVIGGKIVDIQLGIEDGKTLHLETYLRPEDGTWKIYRVRDVSHNFESDIFNEAAIQRARNRARGATEPKTNVSPD